MDRAPIPDYDDYFAALSDSPLAGRFVPAIPIQNARGCWWGESAHCKFCGLNGDSLRFRSKSPSRIAAELRFLEQRYKITRFEAVDNIMDMRYFDTLLPLLKEENRGYSLFYEVKSNLSKEQVKLLSEAGVRAIQPGIESLHTHVLALMKKGVKAYQNIQLLKWCRQYGIDAEWNLLYGFPGETVEDYGQTETFIESIFHLQPPRTCGEVRLDRFSPYFSAPGHYGLTGVRPFDIYRYIYPLPGRQIANLVYFFQFERTGPRPSSLAADSLKAKVEEWKRSASGELIAVHGDRPGLLLKDTRTNRRHACAALDGVQREVYDYCASGKRFSRIKKFLNHHYGSHLAGGPWLRSFLEQMVDWRYMVRDDDIYLSLAVEKEGFYASGGQAPF
jgi:ribosomal peptide maturation radical SAM protein 1